MSSSVKLRLTAEYQVRRQLVLARSRRGAGITKPCVCGVRGAVFEHAIVFEVRDVEVALASTATPVGKHKPLGCARAIAVVVIHVELADHQIGSLPVGE